MMEFTYLLKMVGPDGESFNGARWPLEPGAYVNAAAMHGDGRGEPGLSGYRLGHHARVNAMVAKACHPPESARWLVFRARTADLRDYQDHCMAPEGWVECVGTRAECAAWLRDHAAADPSLLPDVRVVAPSVAVHGLAAHGVATAGPGFASEVAAGVETLTDRQPAIATGPGAVAHARGVDAVAVATGDGGTATASGSRGIAVGDHADGYALAIGRVRARGGPGAVLVVGRVLAVVGEGGILPGVWYRVDPAEPRRLVSDGTD